MNARIQTWFPFPIQVCLNGREWLARQMDGQGMKYLAAGNCFPWIEQWDRAQQLMNTQLQAEWPQVLDRIANQLDPIHDTVFQSIRFVITGVPTSTNGPSMWSSVRPTTCAGSIPA
jgi:hypothetical protein